MDKEINEFRKELSDTRVAIAELSTLLRENGVLKRLQALENKTFWRRPEAYFAIAATLGVIAGIMFKVFG